MTEKIAKLKKPYQPQETEQKIYQQWEASGYFNPDNLPQRHRTPFTVIMPPPNATGVLHMGHGLMLAIEDSVIRFQRMKGRKTLFLPGTDHAAIATQSKVEKQIANKEKKSRYDLGREELLKRIDRFVSDSQKTIISQVKTMGASCDWSREAFTLDEKRNQAVNQAFKQMYDAGLIYQGNRVVNWDPKGGTTISDDEVIYKTEKATLYTFYYSPEIPIAISTTRPETKLGDTAIAVHPEDQRYQKYIGQKYQVDFCGTKLELKVVADPEIDPDFGTGAVGITPAHSYTDWLIAKKHDLPMVQVINEKARITVGDQDLQGQKTLIAREMIVDRLRSQNLIIKEEEIEHNIATAERTGGLIEPLPKLQWFVDVNKKFTLEHLKITGLSANENITLKDIMRQPVENGDINIIPDYIKKTYFHWIDKLDDWCISRQIWYGHRIPVWYKENRIYCDTTPPQEDGWQQEEDTLDTWFSSALWTFSTLGWPEETPDLNFYHPTDFLDTGQEILFFWVARMIMMTGYFLGQIPFKNVYIHGTVKDENRQKMSKSRGDNMDPIDVAQHYGADAGRMALLVGNTPGTDILISYEKIKAYKHFANKIWNASRFILENCSDIDHKHPPELSPEDKKHLDELNTFGRDVTSDIENHRLHLAAEKLYQYFWHTLADKIIEQAKPRLSGQDKEDRASSQYTLITILKTNLKMLHPFMPFVTEELWSLVPQEKDEEKMLMITSWPY